MFEECVVEQLRVGGDALVGTLQPLVLTLQVPHLGEGRRLLARLARGLESVGPGGVAVEVLRGFVGLACGAPRSFITHGHMLPA